MAFGTAETIAVCSTTAPVGTRLCLRFQTRVGRCRAGFCGQEGQCGRQNIRNWTKTVHHMHEN